MKHHQESRSATALIVSADDAFASDLADVLSRFGWATHRVRSNTEVLVAMRERIPEVVVFDTVRDDPPAWRIINTIRTDQKFDFSPRMVITAENPSPEIVRRNRAYCDEFIRRPCPLGEFADRVGRPSSHQWGKSA